MMALKARIQQLELEESQRVESMRDLKTRIHELELDAKSFEGGIELKEKVHEQAIKELEREKVSVEQRAGAAHKLMIESEKGLRRTLTDSQDEVKRLSTIKDALEARISVHSGLNFFKRAFASI